MPNFSIQELSEVVQKSGLPLGGPQMQGAAMGAQGPIASAVQSQSRTPQVKDNYSKVLQQVADMDQRLSKLYGDPTSNLYIENPMNRERLVDQASQTGMEQASDISRQVVSSEKEDEALIKEATSLYKQLATAETKAAKKTGNKTTTSKKDKEMAAYRKKLGYDITDQANLKNETSREIFLTAPTDFQNFILRIMLENQDTEHPQEGYSPEDVRQWLSYWNETFKKKPAKPTKADESSNLLEEILSKL